MKKWVLGAAGSAAGLVVIALVACGQEVETATPLPSVTPANVSVPEPPVTSQPPVSIVDTIDPGECSFVHNINACFNDGQPPADIPLDEYMGSFFMARDDLSQRFCPEPLFVKIRTVERVEWSDASLGNPEPGMMYAQVITPGFKLVLESEGKFYVYHTSVDRVAFVGAE